MNKEFRTPHCPGYNSRKRNSNCKVNVNRSDKSRKPATEGKTKNNSRQRRRRRQLKKKLEKKRLKYVSLAIAPRPKPRLGKEIVSFNINTNIFRSTNARKKQRHSTFLTVEHTKWKKKFESKQRSHENDFWDVTTQTKLFIFHSKIKACQIKERCEQRKIVAKSRNKYIKPRRFPIFRQTKYVDKYIKYLKTLGKIAKNITLREMQSKMSSVTAENKFLFEIKMKMAPPRKHHRPNIILYDFINAVMNKKQMSAD